MKTKWLIIFMSTRNLFFMETEEKKKKKMVDIFHI